MKSSHSEVLSEKKKLQEKLGILQKVSCDFQFLFSSRKQYGNGELKVITCGSLMV